MSCIFSLVFIFKFPLFLMVEYFAILSRFRTHGGSLFLYMLILVCNPIIKICLILFDLFLRLNKLHSLHTEFLLFIVNLFTDIANGFLCFSYDSAVFFFQSHVVFQYQVGAVQPHDMFVQAHYLVCLFLNLVL